MNKVERQMTPIKSLGEIVSQVGSELGVSDWLEIDQHRIREFANVTDDHSAIHLDRNIARAAGFEDTFAHGFLTLSMLMKLQEDVLPIISGVKESFNYGFDRVRFLSR